MKLYVYHVCAIFQLRFLDGLFETDKKILDEASYCRAKERLLDFFGLQGYIEDVTIVSISFLGSRSK
jgi:hypothetical protein